MILWLGSFILALAIFLTQDNTWWDVCNRDAGTWQITKGFVSCVWTISWRKWDSWSSNRAWCFGAQGTMSVRDRTQTTYIQSLCSSLLLSLWPNMRIFMRIWRGQNFKVTIPVILRDYLKDWPIGLLPRSEPSANSRPLSRWPEWAVLSLSWCHCALGSIKKLQVLGRQASEAIAPYISHILYLTLSARWIRKGSKSRRLLSFPGSLPVNIIIGLASSSSQSWLQKACCRARIEQCSLITAVHACGLRPKTPHLRPERWG